MAKQSSSDILNELFSKFNATFDDPEGSESSSSSSSDSDTSKSKRKKKKAKHAKEKSKSRKKVKDKLKRKAELIAYEEEKVKKELKKKLAKKKKSSKNDHSQADKKTETFKHTTIVLDIEEGEIIDEEEKAKRKSMRKKRSSPAAASTSRHVKEELTEENHVPKKKRMSSEKINQLHDEGTRHHHKKSHHDYNKNSDPAQSDYTRHIKREHDDFSYERSPPSQPRPTSRSRHGHRVSSIDVDNSHHRKSPVTRRAPPREGEESRSCYSSSSYKTSWQKASKDSYTSEKTYFYNNTDRRDSNHSNYDSSDKYYYGRSGFGYSGSRKYYDDDDEDSYYDYRRKSSRYNSYNSRRDRDREHRERSRSRSRSRERHPDDVIDKAKLLEIARRNASKLMKKGVLPSDIFSRDQMVAIRAGGKSVEELTAYCKKLAEKDARGDLKDDETDSEDEHFINHPFLVKDRPLPSIVMNIKNAIPLPVRSAHELALENAKLKIQFPVSSGTRHRYKELEWKPVDEDEEKAKGESKSLVPVDGPKIGTVAPMPHISPEPTESKKNEKPTGPLAITAGPEESNESDEKSDIEKPKTFESSTINKVPTVTVDISTLISMRLRAMRQLEENPSDDYAKEAMELATQEMKNWAEAKALEPKFLTQAEITAGPQAWVRRDQLKTAVELKSGMGLHLLQKMGWKPGEGLGKNKEGTTEPLALDIKMDKKGLTSTADLGPSLPNVFDLSAKHPVSALMELCLKRRWGQPVFELCFEHGQAHKKQFVYKVTVNGVEYQPCIATNAKKLAKANCAAFCLQSLGLLPTTKPSNKGAQARNAVQKPTMLQTVPTTAPEPVPAPHPSTSSQAPSVPTPPPPPRPLMRPSLLAPTNSSQLPPPRPLMRPSLLAPTNPSQLPPPRPLMRPSPQAPRNPSQLPPLRPLMGTPILPCRPIRPSLPNRPIPQLAALSAQNSFVPQLPKYASSDPEFRVPRNPESRELLRNPLSQVPIPQLLPSQRLMSAPCVPSQFLRPAQPLPPPYARAPQTQVAPPNAPGGFPGFITF